jgi:hypothetical protein
MYIHTHTTHTLAHIHRAGSRSVTAIKPIWCRVYQRPFIGPGLHISPAAEPAIAFAYLNPSPEHLSMCAPHAGLSVNLDSFPFPRRLRLVDESTIARPAQQKSREAYHVLKVDRVQIASQPTG